MVVGSILARVVCVDAWIAEVRLAARRRLYARPEHAYAGADCRVSRVVRPERNDGGEQQVDTEGRLSDRCVIDWIAEGIESGAKSAVLVVGWAEPGVGLTRGPIQPGRWCEPGLRPPNRSIYQQLVLPSIADLCCDGDTL